MDYKLATESWNNIEKEAAKKVIDSGMCTMGKITQEFEQEFAKKFKCKHCVMVNSGSSANLLAVSAFLYRKNGPNFQPGDEIIVPAVSWATTYYPIYQCGLKLVFVDVNVEDFNISIEEVKKAITPKTKGIMAVNLLGMPCNLVSLRYLCNEHNLVLIEDNCESMSAHISELLCGTIGDIGTHSGFFSHHINCIEAGFITTNDEELYHILLSLRSHGWIRNLPNENHVHNKSGDWFEDTWKFALPGFNVRPNEISSAIGLEQLKKLDNFVNFRIKNYEYLKEKLEHHTRLKHFKLQEYVIDGNTWKSSSWFGFGFISTKHDRMSVVNHLTKYNIESRPIVAGDFTKNPVIKWMPHHIVGVLPNAQIIDKQGFFVGNNGEDLSFQIDHLIETLIKL